MRSLRKEEGSVTKEALMLVDTFIITPKQEWRDASAYTTADEAIRMETLLPEKYRPLFAYLIRESLNELMDNRDHVKAYEVMARAVVSGREGPWYAKNGESLQQVIRKTFYDTILVIHNDLNPFRYDYFIVIHSKEVYTEAEWEVKRDLNGGTYHKENGQILVGHFLKNA
jgi:hypothetical protein